MQQYLNAIDRLAKLVGVAERAGRGVNWASLVGMFMSIFKRIFASKGQKEQSQLACAEMQIVAQTLDVVHSHNFDYFLRACLSRRNGGPTTLI